MHHVSSPSITVRCCAAPTCSATARSFSREELTPSVMMCTSYPVSAHGVDKVVPQPSYWSYPRYTVVHSNANACSHSLPQLRHQELCQMYSPFNSWRGAYPGGRGSSAVRRHAPQCQPAAPTYAASLVIEYLNKRATRSASRLNRSNGMNGSGDDALYLLHGGSGVELMLHGTHCVSRSCHDLSEWPMHSSSQHGAEL